MTRAIIFLGLFVFVKAQLIYPDQFEQMKTTRTSTYAYPNAQQQPNVYPASYGSNQVAYAAPASAPSTYYTPASAPPTYYAPTPTVYSTVVPAAYSTAVPAAYPTAVPAAYPTAVPAAYSTAVPAAYSTAVPAAYTGTAYAAPALGAYSPVATAPIVNPSLQQAKQVSSPLTTTQINNNAVVPQISPLAATLPLDWAYRVNEIISRGVTKLTLDLQNVILNNDLAANRRGNIVFSPLNIAGTLAMVHLGSAGVTFDEVSRILGLAGGVDISTHSELVHQMFGLLMSVVHSKVAGSSRTIDIASAIFLQEGFPIRPEFKTISENVYQNEIRTLNFQQRGKEAQDAINAWVNEKTNGKIPVILNDIPPPTTNVIIASALYFKAEWDRYFQSSATGRRQFFIEPDQPIEIDMMYNGGDFPFYEDKNIGVKILGLPYKGLDTTMYILLPKANGARALGEFTKTLTPETIEFLIQNMKNQTCIVGMPRMKISNSLKLKQVLKSLGLTSLFDPATSDLSLLSPGFGEQTKLTTSLFELPIANMGTGGSVSNDRRQANNREILVFPRFGAEEDSGKTYRRHYFKYVDNAHNYNVEQWATGFSITKMQKKKRDIGSKVRRIRRQSRPVSEDFLHIVQNGNFQTFGLDNLRNSASIVNPRLYADEVLHKVEIDINEKGTEGAAVTAVTLERDGRQKRLVANRPFLFFIRHNPTKLTLFWAMINTPTPNYSNV